MVTFRPGTTPEEVAKVTGSLLRIQQQMEDFFELADSIESENPERDAWKAVFGVDNPAFDENTKEHTWRLRDGEDDPERDESYYIDHFFKYYYVYGRSNHLLLGRENDQQGFQRAEDNRKQFRMYCHSIGLEFTTEAFIKYATSTGKYDSKFTEFINSEDILKDFYRKKILNESINSIQSNRYFRI